jgi:hypothetical protein
MTDRTSAQQVIHRLVERALIGVPKTASADEVNLRLRVQIARDELPCSYGHYRRVVRRILHERAKWCVWEGADPSAVRPRRRTRVRGVRT